MTCRTYLRLGILALLGALCPSRLMYAQAQGCPDNRSNSLTAVRETRITVVSVEFPGESPLSDSVRSQLAEDIQRSELWVNPDELDSHWVSDALTPMRELLRSQGYFKTNVDATPYLTLAQADERRYVLSVVIEAGPQYRLGDLRFASASGTPLIFTEAELREQMQLREGEIFDVTKIRNGLASISKLYGSKGYIDATPQPDTTIDEGGSRIDLLIKVDQQTQYRIAKIEFLGLQLTAQKSLTVAQATGEPFNAALWANFFEANRTHLPKDASPDKNLQVRRDVRYGTVDVTLDFRACPETELVHLWPPLLKRKPE